MYKNKESVLIDYMKICKYGKKEKCSTDIINTFLRWCGIRMNFIDDISLNSKFLCLAGTISVLYRTLTYNIPIVIWILKKHPRKAPYVYVCPSNKMQIWVNSHISQTGEINLPYLRNWNSAHSNIKGLINACIATFGNELPLCMKFSRKNRDEKPIAPLYKPIGILKTFQVYYMLFNLLPHFGFNYKQNRKSFLTGIDYYGISNDDKNNAKELIVYKDFSNKKENIRLLINNSRKIKIHLSTNNFEGLNRFMKSSRQNGLLVFYYCGHGEQKIDNKNNKENIKDIYKYQGLLIKAPSKLVVDWSTYFKLVMTYVISTN